MMLARLRFSIAFFVCIGTLVAQSDAVELVRLSEANWDEFAPSGKEADAIYGDWVLRNDRGNTIFHWLQLLNLGYRIPGVVNTDAHYNFHGSGPLRNFIKSTTDNPAEARVLDMCHVAEQGALSMTNGPFMEVNASSLDSKGWLEKISRAMARLCYRCACNVPIGST